MFFKKISEWSKKKLLIITFSFYGLYFLLTILGPFIIISTKYELFITSEKVGKLTGFGLIVAVILLFTCFKTIKKKIDKLPETSKNQQIVKFSVLLVYDLMLPLLGLFILLAFKDDFELAFSVAKYCIILFIVAAAVDNLFIKYLEAERYLREKALEVNEIEKRR